MDQPYVLAKVHKSASSAEFHVYTAPTKTGLTSFSSRELVAAIDSQGVNIYNVRTLEPSLPISCLHTRYGRISWRPLIHFRRLQSFIAHP